MSLSKLMNAFIEIVSIDIEEYISGNQKLKLPSIPEILMVEILESAISVFKEDETVLKLEGPLCIVGDLHGQLLDLFRIFKTQGLPPQKDYLFLGDFVDRGEFSIETITLVLLLKVLFPNNVNIIRGNHEFADMSEASGFFKELYHAYNSDKLIELFGEMYSYIPVAAVIGNMMLCVHGGIGPNLTNFDQLNEIVRPITSLPIEGTLTDLFWSDPMDSTGYYKPSERGMGHLFGEDATMAFLSSCNIRFIVRGHECVDKGYSTLHHNRIITVFSASNYCLDNNKGAILNVIDNYRYEPIYFDPIPLYKKINATYVPIHQLLKKYPQRKKTLPAITVPSKNYSSPVKPVIVTRKKRLSDSSIIGIRAPGSLPRVSML